MHADERRSPQHLEELRAQEFVADPMRALQRFESTGARSARDRRRIEELERELRVSTSRAREQEQARIQLLEQRLGTANSALDAYRAESARLKGDLRRVRGSRAMKLGRAMLSPLSAMKAVAYPSAAPSGKEIERSNASHVDSVVESDGAGSSTPEPNPTRAGDDRAQPGGSVAERSGPDSRPVPIGQRSLKQLHDEFHAEPTPNTLLPLISRQWFQLGHVQEPAELLLEHGDLVAQFEPRFQRLADQILGYHRLAEAGPSVPPRAPGIAYSPEPGRVMYCVHSTPAFNSNGYSIRTRGVAAGLRAAGEDVSVVARAGYPWDTKVDGERPAEERTVRTLDEVDYVHIPGPALDATPIDHYVLATADAFVREARLQRPCIIQSASNFRTALSALIAARRLGVPFVYEVRGLWEITEAAEKPGWEETPRYQQMAALETLVAEQADTVLVITTQVADELERRGVDRAKMVLATNAVDPDQFLPLPRDEQYAAQKKIRTDVPVIGFAGSIVGYEGLETLLHASAILADRDVDHQVVLAGSGAAAPALKAQRDRHKLQKITFLGRVPVEEMPRLLSTFDIVPLPRRSSAVTELVSPLKPLEAFASAKAVVLSDVAPHVDLAGGDKERGALFPAGDAHALADTLQMLIADPDLRADLGRTARLWTLDERTWSRLGATMAGAHRTARARHTAALSPSAPLSSLRVGLVADEFTTATLAASLHVTALDRERWREQLADADAFDLVFIESAWAGNDGQWTRGVGYYSDDENADLYSALARCRELGIPTVFWNKEDPVHFDRFRNTAAQCDHVFTTDANRIVPYLQSHGAVTRTVSSLPFYAQPAIHNPLPARTDYTPTAAYAGTYYGDRYRTRSRQLRRLLTEASRYGLDIYDRQLAFVESPYRFPEELRPFVRGHLPYDRVIDSYKSHLAQLNVNSVIDSPTMFSRRVVEIAGCGGVVLSGPGRGVTETFGGVIPASNDNAEWRALLHAWSTDPIEHIHEAWFQMRTVYRAHTVDTALTILARTAGLPVTAPPFPTYGLLIDGTDEAALESIASQSVLPLEVFTTAGFEQAQTRLGPLGIRVRGQSHIARAAAEWLGVLQGTTSRTHFEDHLLAARFGEWNRITSTMATADDAGRALARPVDAPADTSGLVTSELVAFSNGLDRALRTRPVNGVELLLPPARQQSASSIDSILHGAGQDRHRRKDDAGPRELEIVVAGHDLKFATSLISALQNAGHTVRTDQWQSHTKHDAARSRELLETADVILAEWGLGNAEWYSQNVKPHQRLIVRVHSQELRRPHLRRIDHANVDSYVFVGELIRRAAVVSHGLPSEKTVVIPNPVDVEALRLPKHSIAAHTLGLVGIVAQPKRLDRALDLLERLLLADPRYTLRIKGKQPADYPWMLDRPTEMAYYDLQYERIDALNARRANTVVFDGHGDDMDEWYRNIGIALSVSDFESFHLTIPDGAASGALPVTVDWPGADLIYPREWIGGTIEDLAQRVLTTTVDPAALASTVQERFGVDRVLNDLVDLVTTRREEQR